MKTALLRYRVMANVVGVLLIVLILVGVPLEVDVTPMWYVFPSTPAIWPEGSTAQRSASGSRRTSASPTAGST